MRLTCCPRQVGASRCVPAPKMACRVGTGDTGNRGLGSTPFLRPSAAGAQNARSGAALVTMLVTTMPAITELRARQELDQARCVMSGAVGGRRMTSCSASAA